MQKPPFVFHAVDLPLASQRLKEQIAIVNLDNKIFLELVIPGIFVMDSHFAVGFLLFALRVASDLLVVDSIVQLVSDLLSFRFFLFIFFAQVLCVWAVGSQTGIYQVQLLIAKYDEKRGEVLAFTDNIAKEFGYVALI